MIRARTGWLLVAILFVTAASPRAAGSAGAPDLRVGDSWTYNTNTTSEEGFRLDGQATFTVDARRTTFVEGIQHEAAFLVLIQGEGTISGDVPVDGGTVRVSGTWQLVGEEVVEASGLKIVSSFLELTAQGVTQPFSQPFTLRVRNLTTVSILLDAWRFPVDVGDAGSVRIRSNATEELTFRWLSFENTTTSNGTQERELQYHVDDRTIVDTPAGRFEAYVIRETWPDGRVDLLYHSPPVGNGVRRVSHNTTGDEVANASLVRYRYQALEPARFLGLTTGEWAVLGGIVAAASIGAAWWVVRRRRGETRSPRPPSR